MYYISYTDIEDMVFDWDDYKESANIKKHNISFKQAAYVFIDQNRIEYYDYTHSDKEERYIAIGFAGKILYVVYTIRKDSIRIISARRATNKEKEMYIKWAKLH